MDFHFNFGVEFPSLHVENTKKITPFLHSVCSLECQVDAKSINDKYTQLMSQYERL